MTRVLAARFLPGAALFAAFCAAPVVAMPLPHGCGHTHANKRPHSWFPPVHGAGIDGVGMPGHGAGVPVHGWGGSAAGGNVLNAPEFFSHVCIPESVDPPAGWKTADSHTHHEECGQSFPPDRVEFDSACLAQQLMAPRDVEISSPLLWATQNVNNGPFVLPGVTIVDGECLVAGTPEQIYRREWEGYIDTMGLPVPGRVTALTGVADSFLQDYLPYGVAARERILQDGIEVSGFDASQWGHLGGLNITAGQGGDLFANFADLANGAGCAPLFDGDVAAAPSHAQPFAFDELVGHYECGVQLPAPVLTGHKNDGTGNWSVPIFEIFERDPGAITGYMHQLWPIDVAVDDNDYGPGVGWDWVAHLDPGTVDEMQCFPTDMRAAFPDNFEKHNTTWPLLAGPDVAMGYVDYLEAYSLTLRDFKPNSQPITYDCGGGGDVVACGEMDHHRTPLDAWYGMYYKLLSSGMRPGISAGTDGTCDVECTPQTYVRMGDTTGLSPSQIYDEFTRALASGHTSLATEAYHFLDLRINGVEVGERLDLPRSGSVEAIVTYEMDLDLLDDPQSDFWFFKPDSEYFDDDDRTLELVQDGQVLASKLLVPADFVAGIARLVIPGVQVSKSGWLATRSRSTSVHTSATPVIIGGDPIANCLEAEYWMIYCDYVQAKIDAYEACQNQVDWRGNQIVVPEVLEQHVGCEQNDIEKHLAAARRVFRSVRDYALGDPAGVCRHGERNAPSCGEPMTLVVGGDLSSDPGAVVRLSCLNAPPDTIGLILAGTSAGGPMLGGTQLPYFVPDIAPLVVTSNHGGHHELTVPFLNGFPTVGAVYAQYVWINPPGCDATDQLSWTRAVSVTLDPTSPYSTCP